MSVDWDYSALAAHYEKRAPYAETALGALLDAAGIGPAARVVDIGAGTGRLTRWLTARGLSVDAIEPCAEMRAIGRSLAGSARWHASEGCATGLADGCADLVSYGSSFNVLPAAAAIVEARRLLGDQGHVLLLWNHRDLADPLQAGIERLIRAEVPDYSLGSRRADPLPLWTEHAAIRAVRQCAAPVAARQSVADFVQGFRAHGTLIRQAGERFPVLLNALAAFLHEHCPDGWIDVPMHTRAWCFALCRS